MAEVLGVEDCDMFRRAKAIEEGAMAYKSNVAIRVLKPRSRADLKIDAHEKDNMCCYYSLSALTTWVGTLVCTFSCTGEGSLPESSRSLALEYVNELWCSNVHFVGKYKMKSWMMQSLVTFPSLPAKIESDL